MLFKFLIAYIFIFFTIFSSSHAQNNDLKTATNNTKNTENKCPEESEQNISRKGRDNSLDQKQRSEPKAINLNLLPSPQLKAQIALPKPKSMQKPLNFVTNNTPRITPTKIPLVMKTGNVRPAPGNYVRLKADPSRKKTLNPNVVNLDLRKEITNRALLKDAVTHRPHTHKHKSPSINFFEDDTNNDPLPPASKQAVTRKSKKPVNKNNPFDNEKDSDQSNDIVQKNGTHVIRISKIPQLPDGETGRRAAIEASRNKCPPQQAKPCVNTSANVAPKEEEVTVAMFINNNEINSSTEQIDTKIDGLSPRKPPYIPQPVDNDSTDVITITNHNYEEIEERPGTYPEVIVDDNIPLATPPFKPLATNAYNNYLQNYQNSYDQYLKYMAETNPNVYNKSNFYPRVMNPEDESDMPETSPPYESQIVPALFGRKPETLNNVVDGRPENNLGRIWRTWKDTEIRIRKPNFFNNKDYGTSLSDLNYGDIISKAPNSAMFAAPAISLNGYYDNSNNPVPYPYSYQPYRYML